jgi:hypothetical protein
MLDQTPDVQQVYHDRARPDQYMRQHGAVDLPQVARHERVLRDQLLLPELAVDQHDVSAPVKLGAAQLEFCAGLDVPASYAAGIVQEVLEGEKPIVAESLGGCCARSSSQSSPEGFAQDGRC